MYGYTVQEHNQHASERLLTLINIHMENESSLYVCKQLSFNSYTWFFRSNHVSFHYFVIQNEYYADANVACACHSVAMCQHSYLIASLVKFVLDNDLL